MDDLDLEKLKQELDDVSGGSRYDVDDIMREAGVSEPEQQGEDLEQLMQKFGIRVEETAAAAPAQQPAKKPEGHAAPVEADMMPEMADTDQLAALFRAVEQTQGLTDEQDELAGRDDEPEEPMDPLEEQDDVFAQLFAQLGEIEQDPVTELFQKPDGHTQTELLRPETEALEEPEEEPGLMARLFDDMDAPELLPEQHADGKTRVFAPEPAEPVQSESKEPDQNDSAFADVERMHWTVPEEEPEEDDPNEPKETESDSADEVEAETQLLDAEDVEELPPEETTDEPKQEKDEPQKQGFFSKWFSMPEDEPDEDDPNEPEETEPDSADEVEAETQILDTEDVEELPPEEAPDEPEQEENRPQKQGFFSKWFSMPEDEPDEDEPEDADESAEPPELDQFEPDFEPKESTYEAAEEQLDAYEQAQPQQAVVETCHVEEVLLNDAVEAPRQPKPDAQLESEEEAPVPVDETQTAVDAEEVAMPSAAPETAGSEPDEAGDAVTAAFEEALVQEAAVATEETVEPPRPRPEDTPVISQQELDAFLSEIEAEEDSTPCASFEELLRDTGTATLEPAEQPKLSLEEFPEEETTVYFDVPVRRPAEEQPHQPELFDVEADQEQQAAVDAQADSTPETAQPSAEETVSETESSEEESQKPAPQPEEKQPEWLNMPLEEVCDIAPALEELRSEGPVMAREVARQKDWIMQRYRAYIEAHRPAAPQEETLEAETEPEEATEADTPAAIDAAGQLREMLEQDEREEGRGSVFNSGSADKPETEPVDREQITETFFEIEQPAPQNGADDAPTQPAETEELPEQPVPQSAPEVEADVQDEQEKPAAQKPRKRLADKKTAKKDKTRAPWPQESAPQDVQRASKIWRSRARAQARRSVIVAVCTLIAAYISCAADFSLLPLPASMDYVEHPSAVLTALVILQLVAMLAAYDVVSEGVQAALHLCPNFSTLVDLALLFNLIHGITRLIWEGEEMPYTCVAMLALFAQMRVRVSNSGTRHYVYKVAAAAAQPFGVFVRGSGGEAQLLKMPLDSAERFVRQTVEPDRNRRAEGMLTVLAVLIAAVLSVIVCVATGDAGRLSYVLAATVTGACQVSLLCAVSMGRRNAARHLAKGGTAVDGLRGAEKMASANAIVLTDEDLFPTGSVALERLELRSRLNDATTLAYAAALAGDSSLGHLLAEEVRTRYGAPLVAHNVIRYADGGTGGTIGGLPVLLGGAAFVRSRGVAAENVPENSLVLAVDGYTAAILVIDYQVPAALFNAMQMLTERHIKILLHTRNHQVTPKLVERLYGLREGTVTVPELEQDRALQNPRPTGRDALAGILVRGGMVPLADCVSTAKTQAKLSTSGAVLGMVAALIGMLLMAYLCYVFVPADARPIRVLLYMGFWFIPIFFIENEVGRN